MNKYEYIKASVAVINILYKTDAVVYADYKQGKINISLDNRIVFSTYDIESKDLFANPLGIQIRDAILTSNSAEVVTSIKQLDTQEETTNNIAMF